MKRVVTALLLVPLVIALVLWGPAWLLLVVTAAVALLCFREYAAIATPCLGRSFAALGGAGGLALLAAAETDALLLLVLITMAAMALAMRTDNLGEALPRVAALVAGLLYIFGAWRFALLLRARSPYWLLYTLALSWVGDIGAYYVGRRFGRTRLAARVSPAKSWEGAAASLVVSVLFGTAFLRWSLPVVPTPAAVALSAIGNVAGQLGDLAESAVKRGAGVKDSGGILPGHGGMLDRVDSTLFVLPVVYLYVRLHV